MVRIAPWIMTSDLDGTKELYILKFAASKGFIVNGLPISNDGLLGEVQGIAGEVLKPYSGNLSGKSRYLRDAMRFGAQTGPGDDNHYPVLLRGNNSTTQYKVPQQQELGRAANKVAYMELGQTGKTDLMTGGNTMVSPPVKGYPWGRIICGDNGSGAYNEQHGVFEPWKPFLEAQEVQKPLYVDTLWLEVGHSDEIISFVPNVKGSGFKVLLASPRKAYEILTDLELKRVPLIRIKAERSGEYHKTINTWRSSFDEEHKRSIGDPMNSVAADGSVIIDYSDEAFSGPELSRGNGMLLFHRFLSGRCVQRWVDKFLLDDPFLKVAAVAHKPEDKQALDQARDANIKALIQQEIEKKNFKHDRWVAIEATAQTSWSTDQQQMVKILITDTIRRLAKAYQADDGPEADEHEQSRRARTVSLLYLMPTLTGRHDAWAPDEDKARDWMARAHDDLLKRFSASRFAHPEGFLKRCKAMWEALPEIEASLPDPTQAAPHAPDDVSMRQALVTKMGQRFGRDLSQVETSELINNLHRQIKLDKIRASLLAELGIKDSDVIDVPILYNHKQGRALTADMVNLVQLNKPADAKKSSSSGCVCIVPKPHGPIWGGEDLFQKEMKEQLKKIGVTAHFVDEWYEYHADDGEIHCGSNQLPVTERQNWWDHKPPGQ